MENIRLYSFVASAMGIPQNFMTEPQDLILQMPVASFEATSTLDNFDRLISCCKAMPLLLIVLNL